MQIRRRAVFLVGYMGAGKTSVGRFVAEKLRWKFVDLDDRIEQRAGRKIAEIFAQEGETAFREMESTALAELLGEMAGGQPTVVAVGGGCFVQQATVALLNEVGAPVIFLSAPVEELWERTREGQAVRPLRADEHEFRRRHEERLPHYHRATHTVDTSGKSISDVAAEIVWLITMGNLS